MVVVPLTSTTHLPTPSVVEAPAPTRRSGAQVRRVYWTRWWVAAVVSLLSAQQCAIWLTFGPISQEATTFYGIDNATVALFSAYGQIAFLPFAPLVALLLDKGGLRVTVVVGCLVDLVGAAVRCAAVGPSGVWAIHLGQFLNGIVGCVVLIAPAKISQVWFPPHERATATSLVTLANYAGLAVGFILVPWQTSTWGVVAMLRQWAVIAAVTTVAAIAYFPAVPRTPPSASAALAPEPFVTGLRALLTNRHVLLLCLACGLPNGFAGAFNSVISIILSPAPWNLTDSVSTSGGAATMLQSSAWLGMWAAVAGVIGGMFIAPLVDRTRKYKAALGLLCTATAASSTWFLLTVQGFIPGGAGAVYAAVIATSLFINPTLPLFVELACEIAYPTSASTVDAVVQFFFNAFGLVFQVIGMASSVFNTAPTTMAWLTPAAAAAALILLFLVRDEHKRLALDAHGAGGGAGSGSGTGGGGGGGMLDGDLEADTDADILSDTAAAKRHLLHDYDHDAIN